MDFPEINEQFMDLPKGHVLLNAKAAERVADLLKYLRHRLEIEARSTKMRRTGDPSHYADAMALAEECRAYEGVLR